jgi:hypothetical protein
MVPVRQNSRYYHCEALYRRMEAEANADGIWAGAWDGLVWQELRYSTNDPRKSAILRDLETMGCILRRSVDWQGTTVKLLQAPTPELWEQHIGRNIGKPANAEVARKLEHAEAVDAFVSKLSRLRPDVSPWHIIYGRLSDLPTSELRKHRELPCFGFLPNFEEKHVCGIAGLDKGQDEITEERRQAAISIKGGKL